MRQFLVYYKERLIGVLYINESGEYKYIRNNEALKIINKTEPIAPALFNEQSDFGAEIPYFKVRLEANEKFDQLEAGFVNDNVRMQEI